jgi:hypothetical protein
MWEILTKGYIETSEAFMFQDDDHIDEFLTALEQGRRLFLKEKEEVENAKNHK